jgi:hypothetical protein
MTGLPPALIPSLIGLLLIAWVVRRNLRSRKLQMDRMLLFPGILLLITTYMFVSDPPRELWVWGTLAGALALGGLLGWHRGKLTPITHDPDTGELIAQPSIAAAVLILAVFAIRFALRAWLAAAPGANHNHVSVVVTNALLIFSVGVVAVQRIEMYLRCRRLLTQAATAA